jgi:hypothetical protein
VGAEQHLRQWLARGQTGCTFAVRVAKAKNGLLLATFPGFGSVEEIDEAFETAAAVRIPIVALFTGIRTEKDLAQQLRVLSQGTRWTITREYPEGLVTDDVMVGMQWQVRDGLASAPMGLAPFATMPVTRRAPYVCIAAWPGEHDNEFWTRYDPAIVHFLDTDLTRHRIDKDAYKTLTRESKNATKALLSELGDDARHYRRVAFRLQASALDHLAGVFAGPALPGAG